MHTEDVITITTPVRRINYWEQQNIPYTSSFSQVLQHRQIILPHASTTIIVIPFPSVFLCAVAIKLYTYCFLFDLAFFRPVKQKYDF